MATKQVIVCDRCGLVMPSFEAAEGVKFQDKPYAGINSFHLCVGCAKTLTVWDAIETVCIPLATAAKAAHQAAKARNVR
jgi:hypothetical protein